MALDFRTTVESDRPSSLLQLPGCSSVTLRYSFPLHFHCSYLMLLKAPMVHSLFFAAAFFIPFAVSSTEYAWNGYSPPGSRVPSLFTPYYVAPGAKGYDSSSPLITYVGSWADAYSRAYTDNSMRWSSHLGASVSFSFAGTGIEWFGNVGTSYGEAEVYIDGKLLQVINAWGNKRFTQQRLFWNYDLPNGKHTIKLINTGNRRNSTLGPIISVDAFVVTKGQTLKKTSPSTSSSKSRSLITSRSSTAAPPWTLVQRGSTGVSAMQLMIISPTLAIIIDKVEHNPLTVSGHPAWAALYNLETDDVTPLEMGSNSFCAGGTFLGNGTFINVGGNPVVDDATSSADFGDLDGLQAIRIFQPCLSNSTEGCTIYENHGAIRMASPRWYNTVVRMPDGSAMIIGGSKKGGWINNSTVNNPTIEYWPPKSLHESNGLPIPLPFLNETLASNLFPIVFLLPDGTIFMAANNDAMIYNWQINVETRLPPIPNGVHVTYPMAGTGVLLPLSPENNYAPEILLCGGSTIDDTLPGYKITSQDPASAQCSRMLLTEEGIAAGWQVEHMPHARLMPDAVLLPTGEIVFVNGAGTGISGYSNVIGQIGQSNADHPVFTPVLYDPQAAAGSRFSSSGMPTSNIPRLYHSVASLTPKGNIMIAGSNPNLDRSEIEYGTEYRVEWLNPPYMAQNRPQVEVNQTQTVLPKLGYGYEASLELRLSGTSAGSKIKVALIDTGYATHAVHANLRLVYLVSSLDAGTLVVTGPPNANIYPPGPGWIFVIVDGVPSEGIMVIVGDGSGPPVNEVAWQNLLEKTQVDQYELNKANKHRPDTFE